MFWPDDIWHYWTEELFQNGCEDYNFITLAGGANIAKSYNAGKYAYLFWSANPTKRNVTIASTTLASLKGRVWGYITQFIRTAKVNVAYTYTESPNPTVLPVLPPEELDQNKKGIKKDTRHGMFAVTAKVGDDGQAVSTWIGKHPDDKLLVVLDEGTDMPMSIVDCIPNLNAHPSKFQLFCIGNSKSTMDLHGTLSTPINGWDSVSVDLSKWKTVQSNGICLYFNPYESPAIKETDPIKKKKLEGFLPSSKGLQQKELELGKESENFYRMVLGFWKSRSSENITVSDKFLKDYSPKKKANWSGYYPIKRVAGLDPAISTNGDKCILRIGDVGHDSDGKVKIDLNGKAGIFEIPLKAIIDKSVENQLADHVIDLLQRYGVQIQNLGIDVTGQGRGFGEIIVLQNQIRGYPLGFGVPLKIYAMSQHNLNKRTKSVPDIMPMSTHMLWNDIREYIEKDCVRNMDDIVIQQLTNRLIIKKGDRSMLESKVDYKRRMAAIGQGHSPDEADATAILFQVVKQVLGILPGTEWAIPKQGTISSHMAKMQALQASLQAKPSIGYPTLNKGNSNMASYVKHTKPF